MASIDALIGKPQVLPYDLQTQQALLARKRKEMEALLLASMRNYSPTTQVGNVHVANWGDAVGRIADAWLAKQEEKKLKGEEEGIAATLAKREPLAMEELRKGVLGETVDVPVPEGAQGPPAQEKRAPDPMRIVNAMMMHPGLKEAGMKAWEESLKGRTTPTEFLKHADKFTAASIIEAAKTGDVSVLKPKGKPQVIEGNVVDTGPVEQGTGEPVKQGYYGATFEQPYFDPIIGVPVKKRIESGEVTGITGGNVSQPAQKGVSAWETGLSGYQIKELGDRKDRLIKAIDALPETVNAAEGLDLAITGALSEYELWARKLAEKLGVVPDKTGRIPITEQLVTVLSQRLLENTKPLGTGNGFTDKDLQFLKDAMAAGIIKDPRTLKAMAALHVVGTMNTYQWQISEGQKTGKPNWEYMVPDFTQPTPQQLAKLGISYNKEQKKWETSLTNPGFYKMEGTTPTQAQPTRKELEERREWARKKYGR